MLPMYLSHVPPDSITARGMPRLSLLISDTLVLDTLVLDMLALDMLVLDTPLLPLLLVLYTQAMLVFAPTTLELKFLAKRRGKLRLRLTLPLFTLVSDMLVSDMLVLDMLVLDMLPMLPQLSLLLPQLLLLLLPLLLLLLPQYTMLCLELLTCPTPSMELPTLSSELSIPAMSEFAQTTLENKFHAKLVSFLFCF